MGIGPEQPLEIEIIEKEKAKGADSSLQRTGE